MESGVLGGFTTFPAFGNETFSLRRDSENALAAVKISSSVVNPVAGFPPLEMTPRVEDSSRGFQPAGRPPDLNFNKAFTDLNRGR
jgi:hypothetical protein